MSATINISSSNEDHENDTLLTFKESMNKLRISRSTLYRLMWTGQLLGMKVGATWRFWLSDLNKFLSYRNVYNPARASA